ncbi:hypothetical protein IW261DRAFT_508501 [Armillaria novae-zelandiae]|uniref:Uncharacterized protein n=1 Tax=Armillaria novae-zelandiae TaxID=153914 RepID=A0AA39UE02_9AGAR|nr:hypothetical protein IW261DRAFT_508501 [Armillaria novae-zelandiae]
MTFTPGSQLSSARQKSADNIWIHTFDYSQRHRDSNEVKRTVSSLVCLRWPVFTSNSCFEEVWYTENPPVHPAILYNDAVMEEDMAPLVQYFQEVYKRSQPGFATGCPCFTLFLLSLLYGGLYLDASRACRSSESVQWIKSGPRSVHASHWN